MSAEISFPLFWGEQINPNIFFVGSLLLYVVLIPLLLFVPTWDVHSAMARAKATELENIATQIRDLLQVRSTEKTDTSASLEQFEKRYKFADQEYHTWPFQISTLKGFITAALIPLISTITSFITQTLLKIVGK